MSWHVTPRHWLFSWRSPKLFPGTAASLLLLVGIALSQQTRALRGVTDETGHVLVGAVVRPQNNSTLWIRSYVTERNGGYHFEELSPNITYRVQATYKGTSSKAKVLSKFGSRTLTTINLVIDLPHPPSQE